MFLPGESPWTEEPGRLQSWGHTESDTTEGLTALEARRPRLRDWQMWFPVKVLFLACRDHLLTVSTWPFLNVCTGEREKKRESVCVCALASFESLLDYYERMCSVAKSNPTLCNPTDYSTPGFSVHGISQARILAWVAISFSRGSSWPRDRTCVSCIGRWILYPWAAREAHMNTLILSDQGPTRTASLNINDFLRCPLSK